MQNNPPLSPPPHPLVIFENTVFPLLQFTKQNQSVSEPVNHKGFTTASERRLDLVYDACTN